MLGNKEEIMFYKKLPSGKYRYFEKYYDEIQDKWRQVTVTMNSKSRASQSEARNKLSQKIERALKNKVQVNTKATIQEVYDEWRIVRDEELKPSSLSVEKKSFSKFLLEFGEKKIEKITGQQIQRFILSMNLSPSTRRLRKCYYNLLFGYAKVVGYIENNPMDKVVLPKIKITQEQIQTKRNKFLDQVQMRKVLDYLFKGKWHLRKALMYEFLFLTGLRVGELLALQWEDFDAKNQIINVRHTLNAEGVPEHKRQLQSPKTIHSYRIVALNKRSIEIIGYFKKNCKDRKFVFVGNEGQTYGRGVLRHIFKKTCLKVLGEGEYTLHMLRHSHISLLVEMNIPIKLIMERVGHSDEKMIMQVYSHTTKKMEDDLYSKLNSLTY